MSKLTNLLNYQSRTRRAGHTSLMLNGVHYDRPGMILFSSMSHAQVAFREALDRIPTGDLESVRPDFARLRIGNVWFKSIAVLNSLDEMTRGRKPEDMLPVIVDHFAMDLLVREHDRERSKMIGGSA